LTTNFDEMVTKVKSELSIDHDFSIIIKYNKNNRYTPVNSTKTLHEAFNSSHKPVLLIGFSEEDFEEEDDSRREEEEEENCERMEEEEYDDEDVSLDLALQHSLQPANDYYRVSFSSFVPSFRSFFSFQLFHSFFFLPFQFLNYCDYVFLHLHGLLSCYEPSSLWF